MSRVLFMVLEPRVISSVLHFIVSPIVHGVHMRRANGLLNSLPLRFGDLGYESTRFCH